MRPSGPGWACGHCWPQTWDSDAAVSWGTGCAPPAARLPWGNDRPGGPGLVCASNTFRRQERVAL